MAEDAARSRLGRGLAALIGIIGTMIGATRSPHTAWTTLAIVLGCVSGLGLLYFLSLATR